MFSGKSPITPTSSLLEHSFLYLKIQSCTTIPAQVQITHATLLQASPAVWLSWGRSWGRRCGRRGRTGPLDWVRAVPAPWRCISHKDQSNTPEGFPLWRHTNTNNVREFVKSKYIDNYNFSVHQCLLLNQLITDWIKWRTFKSWYWTMNMLLVLSLHFDTQAAFSSVSSLQHMNQIRSQFFYLFKMSKYCHIRYKYKTKVWKKLRCKVHLHCILQVEIISLQPTQICNSA